MYINFVRAWLLNICMCKYVMYDILIHHIICSVHLNICVYIIYKKNALLIKMEFGTFHATLMFFLHSLWSTQTWLSVTRGCEGKGYEWCAMGEMWFLGILKTEDHGNFLPTIDPAQISNHFSCPGLLHDLCITACFTWGPCIITCRDKQWNNGCHGRPPAETQLSYGRHKNDGWVQVVVCYSRHIPPL